ncbi:RMR1 [Symbiodinium natans]|uniref:RMR1 protein n=1 Tax=Symbiodinium natans TaxID=878477 RepID=A0A812IEA6_9DINO|nr:RMR1 [Symbiodinium natans]
MSTEPGKRRRTRDTCEVEVATGQSSEVLEPGSDRFFLDWRAQLHAESLAESESPAESPAAPLVGMVPSVPPRLGALGMYHRLRGAAHVAAPKRFPAPCVPWTPTPPAASTPSAASAGASNVPTMTMGPCGLQHCAKASSRAVAATATPDRLVRGRGQRFGSQSYLRSWDLNEPGQRLDPDPMSPKLLRILQALVPFKLPADDPDSESCAICYDSMHGELVRRLPCMHIFHATCIARWLRIRTCCPLDKWDVESALQAEEIRPREPRARENREAETSSPLSSPDSSPLYQPSRSPSPGLRERDEPTSVVGQPLLLIE